MERRALILQQAAQLLLQEGVHAISMRKLAQRIGTSTMVLYTHFKNKQELLNQLYLDGYQQLRRHLEAVPQTNDPLDDLVQLGWAYRKAACDNMPAYFLMQNPRAPGFTVTEESLRKSRDAFAVLQRAVKRCMDADLITPGPPLETAHVLWATIHGLISLQLLGHNENETQARQRFAHALHLLKEGITASKQKDMIYENR